MPSHADLDARSLALHRLAVQKIRRDPVLFERLARTLAHWQAIVDPASQPYVAAWENLRQRGMEACLAMAVEDSEHAAALRQSSPFTGILSAKERFALLKSWRQAHATPAT